MKYFFLILLLVHLLLSSCSTVKEEDRKLAADIHGNASYDSIKSMSLRVMKTGFNAGDGYAEVWIRDYNTFIELATEVYPTATVRENLLVFFRLQGIDGNIVDGFIPVDKVQHGGYDYIYSKTEPRYAGHKNTVETDQETSLVQAVYKYINATGDTLFLQQQVDGKSVEERLEWSLQFLFNHRFDEKHGLIYGATTADWGDVQPEHNWGVYLTKETHYAIDIYDNAMLLIALDQFMELVPERSAVWQPLRTVLAKRVRETLWDKDKKKFIPHIYLNGSPFPKEFDENSIYYHGGTAIAIEAGLLSEEEIQYSLSRMIQNVKDSGAGSIGLTLYPTYPEGYFANKGMYPYGYQNGGDWDWFGARMIQQLVAHGYIKEAVEQLQPMIARAQKNNGYFEWYTVDNQPEGSGTFRGSAGVVYKAVIMLQQWADKNA